MPTLVWIVIALSGMTIAAISSPSAVQAARHELTLPDVHQFNSLGAGLRIAIPVVSAAVGSLAFFALLVGKFTRSSETERKIVRSAAWLIIVIFMVRWFTFGSALAYTGQITQGSFFLGNHGHMTKVSEHDFRRHQLIELFIPGTWLTLLAMMLVQLPLMSESERQRMKKSRKQF